MYFTKIVSFLLEKLRTQHEPTLSSPALAVPEWGCSSGVHRKKLPLGFHGKEGNADAVTEELGKAWFEPLLGFLL